MSYGTSLGITLPTVGVTAGPTWASNLNTAISAIVAVLETKVTPAGMDINADLSFRSGGTSYRAKDVKAVSLTNQDSTLAAGTYPTTLFSTDADGELYYNDNSGRQVQVTSDGSVNVSTTGGITGSGYGTGSVEVNWDSGTSTYRMRDGAGADDFAHIAVDDVKLNDGSAHTLTVAAPAMAADYTLTLPNAVPAASNSLLEMATSGAVTTTKTPAVTSLTTTGAVTATGAVSAAGGLRGGAYQAQAGNYTVTTADFYVLQTGGAGDTTTLPASPAAGQILIIKRNGAGSHTVARNGKTINGAASDLSLGAGGATILFYDGTGWQTLLATV